MGYDCGTREEGTAGMTNRQFTETAMCLIMAHVLAFNFVLIAESILTHLL